MGTVEEIQQFSSTIESARHIEQIENRLILGDTKGTNISWCKLQKYASKIKADLITEEVVLNNLSVENNDKRPTLFVEKVGWVLGGRFSGSCFRRCCCKTSQVSFKK